MKHQIMFSLICLCTLFLNNVFAATTCTATIYESNYYSTKNRFLWNNLCPEETDKKLTFYTKPHSDSDDKCESEISIRDTLSVCVDSSCSTYYNEEHPNGIGNHGWFLAPIYNDTESLCYAAYFYHNEMTSSPNLTNHPSKPKDRLGVGALSHYDTTAYKLTRKLTSDEIYDLEYSYDIETTIDYKFDLPHSNSNNYGTYNPVYKTKKIALIFSDFMSGSSNGSIKYQCKEDTSKCKMVICDFGNPADCVAPKIKEVGEETKYEIGGETYKIKDGEILFATKFVTPPETTNQTNEQYEITPGEQIPLNTLKAIMNKIVDEYENLDLITYRLTDFTINWQKCPAGYYCDYKKEGQIKCPSGTTSDSGSDEITDCYIDTATNPIEFCDNNGCTKINDAGQVFYTPKSTTTE